MLKFEPLTHWLV